MERSKNVDEMKKDYFHGYAKRMCLSGKTVKNGQKFAVNKKIFHA